MSFAYAYTVTKEPSLANQSTDRILKLVPMEGGAVSTNRSVFNKDSMFKGDKQLHAIQDAGLWYVAYRTKDGSSGGNVPEALKQRWTSFVQLKKYLDSYFAVRNVKIEEVIA